MIRVAFVIAHNPVAWFGGFNVIKNLISSMNANKVDNLKIVLFINSNTPLKYFQNLDVEIVKTDFFSNMSFFTRVYSKINIFFFGKSNFFDNFFLKYKINLVSHHIPLGRNSQIKSFPWITDFQEIYHPEYFTFLQLFFRRFNIFFSVLSASKIILSSIDSQNDLRKIIKINKKKIFIHPFFFDNYPIKNILNFKIIKNKYKINKNFFFLPNQYWPHKNHLLVLKAILYLKEKYNLSISVVSSGYHYAKGSRTYFNKVMDYARDHGLNKNYTYVGVVNEKELYSLIYHSKAIINPSVFEGWNTSVMQAKSLFKENIISNIRSHIEQKNNKSFIFRNNNHISLAKAILKVSRLKKYPHPTSFEKKKKKKKFLNFFQKQFLNQNPISPPPH